MSKIQAKYLIIGRGRVARHFVHYFSMLNLSCMQWDRSVPRKDLHEKAKKASHVLLLISDKAIEPVAQEILEHTPRARLIHFSGALVTEAAVGVHPLMTFGEELYDKDKYLSIPFVVESDAPSFEDVLPGLPNEHARLDKDRKAHYHALCVLAGNFSCMLWQRFFEGLEQDLSLPPEIGQAYLLQQTANILCNPQTALTGPLVRGDQETIQKNIGSLGKDPFAEIYKAFVATYEKKKDQVKRPFLSPKEEKKEQQCP